MNLVDLVVIGVAVLAGYRGWRRGLLGQVFEIGGGFLGLVLGVALGPAIVQAFVERPGLQSALLSLLIVFVAVTVGQTLGFLAGHRFRRVARDLQLGGVDSGMGAGFGVLVWLVTFWLLGSMLVQGPSRSLARELRDSKILQATNEALPQPPDIFAYIRQYLGTSGFPQVFAGLPPGVGEPVDLPTQKEANQATRRAKDSTVRVVVEACGGVQLGSGWVADTATVVTNAHVVSGGDGVTIQQPQGGEVPGVVVLFDPETDVAVIHAEGLSGDVLPLEPATQDRGTPGATLGYPGDRNGKLVAHRAAVQNSFQATGRDIYGRNTVTREVYELRSPVRQGDSGGPFVLPNGEVAGVVFAASTTDADTGYALTGAEVEDEVRRGAGRTSPTSTGHCTH